MKCRNPMCKKKTSGGLFCSIACHMTFSNLPVADRKRINKPTKLIGFENSSYIPTYPDSEEVVVKLSKNARKKQEKLFHIFVKRIAKAKTDTKLDIIEAQLIDLLKEYKITDKINSRLGPLIEDKRSEIFYVEDKKLYGV